MQENVEKWLVERRKEIKDEDRIKRSRLLIINGLYKKEKITKEEYQLGIRSKKLNSEYEFEKVTDDDGTTYEYYRKSALQLTSEEYDEVSKYFKVKDISKKTGQTIKQFALILLVLTLISTVILSVSAAVISKSIFVFFAVFVPCIFASLFTYFLLEGFGDIVSDVKEIKNNLSQQKRKRD